MSESVHRIPGLVLTDRELDVPLDHDQPAGERITVFAREVAAAQRADAELPWLVFFQGGPGFGAPRPPSNTGWVRRACEEYRVLLLDQRGTGRSTPVSHQSLARFQTPEEQAAYLMHFRADSIVRDAEHIRRALLGPEQRWTALGQSFGGFCAVHYLCAAPEGLAGVLITGGLPPLEAHPDEIYRRTYRLVGERNRRYYARYPGDVERVQQIVQVLERGEVHLPCGDVLSARRLQLLGLHLGFSEGFEILHYLFEGAFVSGREGVELSYAFLRGVENALNYDTNPIFSILHEACYAQEFATRWSAHRVRSEFPEFEAAPGQPVFLTGEMIYPWLFQEIGPLRALAPAAELLAAHAAWPRLYDAEALRRNEVPCAAAVYYDDMYVERELSMQTARAIGGLRPWVTNEYEHNGLRADGERVLGRLFGLLRG